MSQNILFSPANNRDSGHGPRHSQGTPKSKGCRRCSTWTKDKRPSCSSTDTARYLCDIYECSSSFRRPSDLVRHKKSIHGPKSPCPYMQCGYATGREDKMNEHIRKIHRVQGGYSDSYLICTLVVLLTAIFSESSDRRYRYLPQSTRPHHLRSYRYNI